MKQLLVCTDLDRTLIPNGPQPESADARQHFAALVMRPEVLLAYVTGRHRMLVQQAIDYYQLPAPDFVIGDVGTTIYRLGPQQTWTCDASWEAEISRDWEGHGHADITALLRDIPSLRLQESAKQNAFKVSYYVPMQSDRDKLARLLEERLQQKGIAARLIWSVDEPAGVGLLDILPEHASKYHAIEALMQMHGFDAANTVFCGDSGNDIEVLASPIPAVLVANCQVEVRDLACQLANDSGNQEQLYVAQGDFMGLNGNYSGGMLEGIAHYHPDTLPWMAFMDLEPQG